MNLKSAVRNADLFAADLEEANFYRVNLSGSNLRDADLKNTVLQEVDWSNCNVIGAVFTNALGLTEEEKKWLQENGDLNVPVF